MYMSMYQQSTKRETLQKRLLKHVLIYRYAHKNNIEIKEIGCLKCAIQFFQR